jgi:release factor glutamine methyltransferase
MRAASIRERVAAAKDRLTGAGIPRDEAELDARLLAQHVLGWDTTRLLTSGLDDPPPGFADRFDELVARRSAREPLAYITGLKEFWNLAFEVSPAVLVPRPETETLVEAALSRHSDRDAAPTIADVCTGTGCVAIALAVERPHSRVTATDVSTDALVVAQRNAERHAVSGRVRFVASDLFARVDDRFDLIVSNPPYVPARDRSSLAPEVSRHEPGVALFGGDDGLDVIRRLVHDARQHLRPGGALMFEFGCGQETLVREIITNAGLTHMELRSDLQGIPRVAIAEP